MNFEKMTKEELIKYIEELNEEQNGKYGLLWDKEKEPEKIVEECDKFIPILEENKNKFINNKGQNHILIQGDNFHALSVLNYTHKESIDVIYIDPPYNTGNKDFIYNDKYIDFEDGYKHSKWLNFMEKRLKLSRNLLKEDGVMFISIDDNEFAQLKLLCDKIFGENNVEVMVWHKVDNDSGKLKITYRFRTEHEYIIVVYKNKTLCRKFKKFKQKRNYKNTYTNPDNDPRGAYKQGIISDTEEKSNKNSPNYYSITTPGGRVVTRRWRVSKEEMDSLIQDNRIYFGKDGNSIPSLKVFINEEGEVTPVSILENLGTAKTAGQSLIALFDGEKVFSYPKPVELIKHLIQIASEKDDIILDFFAGSGTTAQAVLELNKEDKGNRKFILCTNDENGICENVTYQRIKTVITGISKNNNKYSDGIAANLRYYKTMFVDNLNNRDQLYYDLTEKCIPMLSMKENCFNRIKSTNEYRIFENDDSNKVTAVYFDLFGNKEQEFVKELEKINKEKVIYKFSLSDYIDTSIFKSVTNYRIEAIPYRIVEMYRKLVKISKGDD